MEDLPAARGRGRGRGVLGSFGAAGVCLQGRQSGRRALDPLRGHHPLPGRQRLLQQTDEKGCSRLPLVSQGSAPTSPHVIPDSHKLRMQGSGYFAVGGDGLELGEVLSSAAPTWKNGETPLCIDSWEQFRASAQN